MKSQTFKPLTLNRNIRGHVDLKAGRKTETIFRTTLSNAGHSIVLEIGIDFVKRRKKIENYLDTKIQNTLLNIFSDPKFSNA